MKISSKRIFNICGGLITVAALFFVFKRFHIYGDQLDFTRLGTREWTLGIIMLLVYGGSNIFLAGAWHCILKHLGHQTIFSWALKVYGISQIGKYIPGNIFHFVGRQALGMAEGISARSLAKSSVWEIGLLCFSGMLFGILVSPVISDHISASMSLVVFCSLLALVFIVCIKSIGNDITIAIIYYVLFLAISGGLFTKLVVVFSDFGNSADADPSSSLILGCFIIAWLVGLLTPGAPAGIGVRETILLVLLGGHFDEADLLMALLAGRAVTVGGDVIFFLVITVYNAFMQVAVPAKRTESENNRKTS